MRREWRKVLAFSVLFLAGVGRDAASQDVKTEKRGLGPATVRLTIELTWGHAGNGVVEAERVASGSALGLEITEGRVLEAITWPPSPQGRLAELTGWGPAEGGGWRLGDAAEGRVRARIETSLDAKLIVRRGDQVVSLPVAAVLERPQRTPSTAPMTVTSSSRDRPP